MTFDDILFKQRFGYMCLTDFAYELGNVMEGNKIYPSINDLKYHMPCADDREIVKVKIEFVEIISKETNII